MRRVAFVLLLAIVGACNADDSQRPEPSDPSTTTAPVNTSTTTVSVAPSSTSAPAPSTTLATTADENPGSESIGVTEKITITITDQED